MGHKLLVGIAAFIVIIAGLKAAEGLVVPFLLAVFLAILCAPSLAWMKRHRVPSTISILLIMAAVVLLLLTLTSLLNTSVSGFSEQLPVYQESLEQRLGGVQQLLTDYGLALPKGFLHDTLNPDVVMGMIKRTLTGFGGVLSNTFLVVLTLLFILLEASSFPQKLQQISRYPEASGEQVQRIIQSINRYMAIKVMTSFATGFLVWLVLSILGIDFPVLWGLTAFLLNFVPTIGSIIAALPAVLLAIIQSGFADALLVAGGYLAINVAIGSVLEPQLMGRNLGLSTLVVFLSLVFWGWVLGPVGMILSVPLTMTLKLALENNPDTQAIAIMLGTAGTAGPGMEESRTPVVSDGD
jgi:predicted PurR-regulated permease PerM